MGRCAPRAGCARSGPPSCRRRRSVRRWPASAPKRAFSATHRCISPPFAPCPTAGGDHAPLSRGRLRRGTWLVGSTPVACGRSGQAGTPATSRPWPATTAASATPATCGACTCISSPHRPSREEQRGSARGARFLMPPPDHRVGEPLTGLLDVERRDARMIVDVIIRALQRLLARTVAISHNDQIGARLVRSLVACAHGGRVGAIDHLGERLAIGENVRVGSRARRAELHLATRRRPRARR